MALLFMDGFESGEYTSKYNGAAGVISSTTTRFNTGRSMVLQSGITRMIPASSQIFMGYAVMNGGLDTSVRSYICLVGDNGSVIHLAVGMMSGQINLYRGGLATVIASYTGPVNVSTWYSMEVSATIADSGGTCVVKMNGNVIINYTGDTRNGGVSTQIDAIQIAGVGYQIFYDDLYVCDNTGPAPYNTFLGDVRVYALSPTGAGSSTQFTPSTGANYAAVDEIPYSATDYVTSSTTGNRDLYTMSDLPASVTTVLAVQNNIVAKKTDAAATVLKPAIKSGATVYYGADTNLGATDATIVDLRTTDPNTSAAWTASGVNALEAGFELG